MSLTPTIITAGMLAESAQAYIAAQPPTRLEIAPLQPQFRRGNSEGRLAELRAGIRSHFPLVGAAARAEGEPSRAGSIRQRPGSVGPGLELSYAVTPGFGFHPSLRPRDPISYPDQEAPSPRPGAAERSPPTVAERRAALRVLCERTRRQLGRSGELAVQAVGEGLSPGQARRLAAQALRVYRAALAGRRQIMQRAETLPSEDQERVQAFAQHDAWHNHGTTVLEVARSHGVRLPSLL